MLIFFPTVSSKNVFLRLPESFSPFERMILQATGNLQRLLSAYYNVPSQVKIIKNDVVQSTDIPHMQFERKIVMFFEEKCAYEADSILLVKDSNVLELIEKHKYGLGQIFGYKFFCCFFFSLFSKLMLPPFFFSLLAHTHI